jgi:hypothetical protein
MLLYVRTANNQKAAQLMSPIKKALVPLSVIKYALRYQINSRLFAMHERLNFHPRRTHSSLAQEDCLQVMTLDRNI